MTTHMRMLSGLALTAAALVILSSDALAKSGGSGGMRSSSSARTPSVISKGQTTPAVRKQTLSTASQAKLKAKLVETKPGDGKIEEKKKHPRHPIYLPVGIGAPLAPADPLGCVYERRTQKLPGGGLERVIVKICPGA